MFKSAVIKFAATFHLALICAVPTCRGQVKAQLWTPEEKPASASVVDGDEHTFEAFCNQSPNSCGIGLQFENARSVDKVEVDYVTLTGHAYEPALGGQELQYWADNRWRRVQTEMTIDYRQAGVFASVQGSGFSRWTYQFEKLETNRLRILLSRPANVENWHRVYAVRDIRTALTGTVSRPGTTQTLGTLTGRATYLRPNENLAVAAAGAEVKDGEVAEVRWRRKMMIDTAAWSPDTSARAEWWDGERYRPVEAVSASDKQPLRFLPISTTRLRIHSRAKAIRSLRAYLSSDVQDYASELEHSRIDLLGMRFRRMSNPTLAGMRGLLLPLDFAQIAIGRPADIEETHVTWNGSFFMVKNPSGGNWNHGAAERLPPVDRHDRWFTFSTGDSAMAGAEWSSTTSTYIDGGLPAPVITWRKGAFEYQETLFVTAPESAAYGTMAELSVRNVSTKRLRADVAFAMGRRPNSHRMGGTGTPLVVEPEPTGYRLADDRHTVIRGNDDVILYAETSGKWGGTDRENHLQYSFALGPNETRMLHFFAPSVTEPIKTVPPLKWSVELEHFRGWWSATLDGGMKLDLPEPEFNSIYKNLLTQSLIITQDGDSEVKYGSYSYEDYFGIEEGWPAIALAQYGHSESAETILSIMLSSRLMDKSNYHHQYRNGLEPWYAVTAYRLKHNRAWLQKIAPDLESAAEWTIKSIHSNVDAKYPGILPKHAYGGDIHTPAFSLYSNAACWRGLHDTAIAFRELDRPDLASRYEKEAEQYRTRLLALVDLIADTKAKPAFLPMAFDIGSDAEHRDREPTYDFLTPDVPEGFQWTYLGNFWNLFAPMFLELKLFDASDPRARWIPDYMNEHGGVLAGLDRFTIGLDQIYGKGYYEALLEHGDREQFVTSLYSIFAHGMSQNLNSFPEVAGVFSLRLSNAANWDEYNRNVWDWGFPGWTKSEGQPLSAGPGMALQMLRMALVRETTETASQDTLRLLDGVPAAWFGPGKKIAIQNAPTFFGKLSLETNASDRRLVAHIRTEPAFSSRQIVLRVCGQDQMRAHSVTVNGKEWTDFSADEVRLPGKGQFDVVVLF